MSKSYEVITNRIIELLEQGTVPWQQPWNGEQAHPRNLVSDKKYRGINAFLLGATAYESPYWLTYKQAKSRNGHVRKGEKGFPCIYWNWVERLDEETGEIDKKPFLRHYTVFNVTQCESVNYPELETTIHEHERIEKCEQIVREMPNPPNIQLDSTVASYHPSSDTVRMPALARFESAEEYYSTLFHELAHSTGHKSRLDRQSIKGQIVFGSKTYGNEELVAEMGATYFCGHAGIENKTIDNSAAYIQGWLTKLRANKTLVIKAAGQAQKAVDYVLGEGGKSKT